MYIYFYIKNKVFTEKQIVYTLPTIKSYYVIDSTARTKLKCTTPGDKIKA